MFLLFTVVRPLAQSMTAHDFYELAFLVVLDIQKIHVIYTCQRKKGDAKLIFNLSSEGGAQEGRSVGPFREGRRGGSGSETGSESRISLRDCDLRQSPTLKIPLGRV